MQTVLAKLSCACCIVKLDPLSANRITEKFQMTNIKVDIFLLGQLRKVQQIRNDNCTETNCCTGAKFGTDNQETKENLR